MKMTATTTSAVLLPSRGNDGEEDTNVSIVMPCVLKIQEYSW